jgi:hypothetical protein
MSQMGQLDQYRQRATQLNESIMQKQSVALEKLSGRGDVMKNLVTGYVRNVEVVIDVTDLLKSYTTFATEILNYMTTFEQSLGTVTVNDLKELKEKTGEKIKQLEVRYKESLATLQTLIPNRVTDLPANYDAVKSVFVGGKNNNKNNNKNNKSKMKSSE